MLYTSRRTSSYENTRTSRFEAQLGSAFFTRDILMLPIVSHATMRVRQCFARASSACTLVTEFLLVLPRLSFLSLPFSPDESNVPFRISA